MVITNKSLLTVSILDIIYNQNHIININLQQKLKEKK